MRLRGLTEHPTKLRNGLILFPLLVAILGYFIDPAVYGVETSTSSGIASGLLTAQSAILAVAFTVTILGVELNAPEYSPRLTRIFTRIWIFKRTFQVFAAAMGIAVLLMLFSGDIGQRGRTAITLVTIVLAAEALLMIYLYLVEAVDRMTPAGVIRSYQELLGPDYYLEAVAHAREGPISRHPTRGLQDMIVESVDTKDIDRSSETQTLAALEAYLEIIEDAAKGMLEQRTTVWVGTQRTAIVPWLIRTSQRDIQESKTDSGADERLFSEIAPLDDGIDGDPEDLFHPAIEEGLPQIVERNRCGIDVEDLIFDSLDELLETGINYNSYFLCDAVFSGVWEMIENVEGKYEVDYKSWELLFRGVSEVSKSGGYQLAGEHFERFISVFVGYRDQDGIGPSEVASVIELYTESVGEYSDLLRNVPPELTRGVKFDYPNQALDDCETMDPGCRLVLLKFVSMSEIIAAVTQFSQNMSEDSRPILPAKTVETLCDGVIAAVKYNHNGLARALTQLLIEGAVVSETLDGGKKEWNRQVSRLVAESEDHRKLVESRLQHLKRLTNPSKNAGGRGSQTSILDSPVDIVDNEDVFDELQSVEVLIAGDS